MPERQVMRVGAMPATPANVIAYAVFGKAFKGVVQRIDANFGEFPVLFNAWIRHNHVVGVRQGGIVNLQHETGIDDCLVLVLHRIGKSEEVLLIVPVVLVIEEVFQPSWRQGAHESFFDLGVAFSQRCLKEIDVSSDFLLADIGDRAGADRPF